MSRYSNVREFNAAIARHAPRPEERMTLLLRAASMRGLQGLVLGTRVDTGRARGNWQVTEDAPAQGYQEELKDKAGGETIARGSRVALHATLDRMVWIHNGVPYIGYLEQLDKMLAGTFGALTTWAESAAVAGWR